MNEIPHPYRSKGGYIGLPVVIDGTKLPAHVSIMGSELLLKSEFHVTLLCVKFLPPDQQKKALQLFSEYVERRPIIFEGFSNEFRYVQEEERASLIVRCKVSDLAGLFKCLEEGGIPLPVQPLHITLYTKQSNLGIGINSEEQMERYSKVEFPTLFATLSA